MKKIKFEKIENFILFGGGQIVLEMCIFLKKNKKNIIVITSKEQSENKIYFNQYSFKNYLVKNKIKFKILSNLKKTNQWTHLIKKNSIAISNSCRWIFKHKEINLFKNKLINIHGANLPLFRGAGGLSWNMMTNYYNSGITIHLIDKNIDKGMFILKKSFTFPLKIRNSLLEMQKYSINFQKKQVINFLSKLIKNKVFKLNIIKDSPNSCYWPRISTEKHAWINWSWNANQISDFINSCSTPYIGAATTINKKVIRFKKAKPAKSKINFHPYQYGLIYKKIKNEIYVASKKGGVIIDISNIKNKKGFLGKRLLTTNKTLNKSLEKVF